MRLLIIVAVVLAVATPVVIAQVNQSDLQSSPFLRDHIKIRTSDNVEHPFNVELALTAKQQAQGLMFRKILAEDAGMLFLFKDESPRRFWMKNTLIPLDIIFIRRDGTIHHIHENAVPHDLSGAPSNGPAYAVLEINGGLSGQLGLKKGDKVLHTVFIDKNSQ